MRRSCHVLAALLVALLLVPMVPTSSAVHAAPAPVGLGIDTKHLGDATAEGAKPRYASFWVGKWTATYGWDGLRSALATSQSNGATLVVLWYYWGNDIAPGCIENGCNGKSRAEWSNMTAQIARVVRESGGGRDVLVVLEPEFNKQTVTTSAYAPKLDAHLAAEATRLKATPGLKVVVGYGLWDLDLWSRVPRTLEAADALGFQAMRASTRHNESAYRGVTQDILAGAKRAHALAPSKPVVLYDLALSTYSPRGTAFWERVQAETLHSVLAKRSESGAYGLSAIVYRAARDDPRADQSDYFGAAEVAFGLQRADGAPKAGWAVWAKGMGAPTSPWSPFSGVKGNEWWIEARVSGAPARVEARVDGGAWLAMSAREWGAHAVSTRAPAGSVVELRASYANGTVARAAYDWPSAAPAGSAPAFEARFEDVRLYEWWAQVDVRTSVSLREVHARVEGGTWVPLAKQDWGAWAASLHVPAGAKVEFRATSTTGATVVSPALSR